MGGLKLALIQLAVCADKATNLARAVLRIKEASSHGAQVVALPECFNSPYGTNYFAQYAEAIPGETTKTLARAAKENNVYVIGGSIPERDNDKIFNTCTIWSPSGDLLAQHRKMHLFDIDVPGGIKFQESDVLSPGVDFTSFDHPACKIGIGICYDIRFAEMAQVYAKQGCNLLIYPGAFNMTTGPAHWELLQRARAVDNQLYVATVSPARDDTASYTAWGHSTVVDPWGEVIATTEHSEDIVYADIDTSYLNRVRRMIPLTTQRKPYLYNKFLMDK